MTYRMGIVLPPRFYLSSLSGVTDSLQLANAHNRHEQGPDAPAFHMETLGISEAAVTSSVGLKIKPDKTLEEALDYDLIYIPGFFYRGSADYDRLVADFSPALNWMGDRWQEGGILAANCTGNFLLAETGLLDGREATATWWLEHQFRKRYPWVKLDTRQLICEDLRLISSGAMTASFDLALKLIAARAGSAVAAQCAKIMLINSRERTQSTYQDLSAAAPSADPVVSHAQYWLQTHLRDRVDQSELANQMGVSQRTLIRRFKAELGVPPLTYLQNLRIETAKKLLENTSMHLGEIIEQVGYTDQSSFSRLFKQRTDLSPAMYRKRFQVS